MRPEIELFEKSGDKLIPTKHCYAIEWLKAIIDNYPEEEYMKIFKYLQYMTCPYPDKNPFFNTSYSAREEVVVKAIAFDMSLDDNLIVNAREELTALYDDTMAKAYKAMRSGVEQLSEYMEKQPITDGRDSNFDNKIKAMEKFPKLRENFEKIENAYLESLKVVRVRGEQDLAYDQVGGR